MPRVAPRQTNFNGGEVSPLLYGRVDIPRYKESLAVCKNYIPLIQGPVTRRSGTQFIGRTKFHNKKTRIIGFEFSATTAYQLEFGDQYIRIYKNYALLTNAPKNIEAITQASPGVLTITAHGYSNGDRVVVINVGGMTELNNREYTFFNVATDTFQLKDAITGVVVDTSGYTAFTTGGTVARPYEVPSTYLESELFQIEYTQSNDVLYLVHPAHRPAKLSRTADTTWTLGSINFWDGPYYDVPQVDITAGVTLTLDHHVVGPQNYWTVTSSSVLSTVNGGQGFLSSDVGRAVRFKSSGTWYTSRITQVDSTTVARVADGNTNTGSDVTEIRQTLGSGTVASQYRFGLWNGYDGYPTSVVFHQDRLVFGGAGGQATRFDGSNSSDYENMSPTKADGTVTAAMAYSFQLLSNDQNAIQWMTSDEQGILIGTTGGEWLVTAADVTSALSATSISAKRSTSHGSEAIQAVQSGKCTLFAQRGNRKLRELNYFFDVSGFRAADLTQISEHISNSGFVQFSVQKNPQPILWALRADGVLIPMTYERELDALKVGWSRQIIGGTFSGGDAVVESVSVIPSSDGENQDVWLVVKRTVDSQEVRYLEYITPLFDDFSEIEDGVFVDSSLTYSGAATNKVSGANHLNGQTVSLLVDGLAQADRAVINGKVTLDPGTTGQKITLGLKYDSDIQFLRIDAGAADGTAMGKTRRTHRVGIQFLNTLGVKLGPDFDTLDDITLDELDSGTVDTPGVLFTGISSQIISCGYDFDNTICLRQNQPFPGTILGYYPMLEEQDRG